MSVETSLVFEILDAFVINLFKSFVLKKVLCIFKSAHKQLKGYNALKVQIQLKVV